MILLGWNTIIPHLTNYSYLTNSNHLNTVVRSLSVSHGLIQFPISTTNFSLPGYNF